MVTKTTIGNLIFFPSNIVTRFLIMLSSSSFFTLFQHVETDKLTLLAISATGNKALDSYRTGELCLHAMKLSMKILSHDGVFLSKIFMGSIFKEIDLRAKENFKKVVKYKPLSSKKESKEIYIYCKGILKI